MNEYEKNVKKGIRTALNLVIPGMALTSNALRMVSACLSNLNEKLVEQCKKEPSSKRKSQAMMPVTVAHKVVTKVFPGQMRLCAEAAAHKCIMKYNVGILTYIPHKRVEKKKRPIKSAPAEILPEFIKGVPIIAQMIHPDMIIANDTKKLVALILQKMTKTIAEKSRQTSKRQGILKPTDIVKAVDYCMASIMAKHAISEGARNTLMFTSGCNKYKIEDFEVTQKNNTRVKRKGNKMNPSAAKRIRAPNFK